jgi:hypothetical protein
MLSLLTLPFRLFFGILFGLLALPFAILGALVALPAALLLLPFLLLRFLFKTVVGLLVLPLMLLAAIVGIVAVSFTALLPLVLPIALAVFCVWIALKLASPAATV